MWERKHLNFNLQFASFYHQISAETEQNLAQNSLGSLENLGDETRSLAQTSARSQV